jgi:predicted transcriptional regulator
MKTIPRAKEIMSRNPVTLKLHGSLREAALTLVARKIISAPVVDDDEQFVGMFSQQGCMVALIDAVYDRVPALEVSAFLEPGAGTVSEDTGLLSIAQIYVQGEYRNASMPVLRDGKVVGLVSRLDVIKAFVDYLADASDRKTQLLYLSALKGPDEHPTIP